MIELNIFLEQGLVGRLSNDPTSNRFAFEYAAQWIDGNRPFALSPQLPLLRPPGQTDDAHSACVRQFFENLLPEGQGLEAASVLYQVSKSNLAGLLVHLGKDMAGALRVEIVKPMAQSAGAPEGSPQPSTSILRPLSHAELSGRIRSRDQQSFIIWDGKIRMSIAGYQDKIVAYENEGSWSFVEGGPLASNVIIKPEPVKAVMAGMTGNEFMCMSLSRAIGLPTARVRLDHVPEPVLVIHRFDRLTSLDGTRVQRLHVIDGCQALGISSAFKYERPHGDKVDVRDIRDGASLAHLFELLTQSANPVAQRVELLRWVIFQVLIGNTDAHAKNLSFYCGTDGLRLTPAYDMLCAPAFAQPILEDTYAMAIGDAFMPAELTPFEWAEFANLCRLPQRLVSNELKRLGLAIQTQLPSIGRLAAQNGVPAQVVSAVSNSISEMCDRQLAIAGRITQISADLLSEIDGVSPRRRGDTPSG